MMAIWEYPGAGEDEPRSPYQRATDFAFGPGFVRFLLALIAGLLLATAYCQVDAWLKR